MSSFSKASFKVALYANFRPTYPKSLFDRIYQFHDTPSAQWDKALDLGCGTGQATSVLAERFPNVVGADPSPGMISSAQEQHGSNRRLTFVNAKAEDLSSVEDESIDLVTAAQSAHWFDHERLWPELARILKRGGSAAFWCYSEFRLTKYPSLTHDIDEYSTVPTRNLGQYWERPGRTILQDHLQSVCFPTQPPWDASSGHRVYYVGDHYSTTGPNPAIRLTSGANEEVREVILRKVMTWEELENYLRTWSALHTFHAKHPEDRDHADGDIVQRFMRHLKDGVTDELKSPSDEVEVEWPLALIMIKKAL